MNEIKTFLEENIERLTEMLNTMEELPGDFALALEYGQQFHEEMRSIYSSYLEEDS